jgi:hypothetical protein
LESHGRRLNKLKIKTELNKRKTKIIRASPKGCEKIDAKTMYWGLC